MAQYPLEVQISLPGGVFKTGNQALREMFAKFCRSPKAGGLKRPKFTTSHTLTVSFTINVQWLAYVSFLAEPCKSADAYVTKDVFMYT